MKSFDVFSQIEMLLCTAWACDGGYVTPCHMQPRRLITGAAPQLEQDLCMKSERRWRMKKERGRTVNTLARNGDRFPALSERQKRQQKKMKRVDVPKDNDKTTTMLVEDVDRLSSMAVLISWWKSLSLHPGSSSSSWAPPISLFIFFRSEWKAGTKQDIVLCRRRGLDHGRAFLLSGSSQSRDDYISQAHLASSSEWEIQRKIPSSLRWGCDYRTSDWRRRNLSDGCNPRPSDSARFPKQRTTTPRQQQLNPSCFIVMYAAALLLLLIQSDITVLRRVR